MRLLISRGLILLFFVGLGLVAPTDSPPLSLGHTDSSVDEALFNNQTASASPVDTIVNDGNLEHPEPDNLSLEPPSPPFMNHTSHANFTTAFRLRDDFKDSKDSDKFKLDCTGAEYFSPSVEVDCYYLWHVHVSDWDPDLVHLSYFVSMPPVGLSYSKEISERWANHFMEKVDDIKIQMWPKGMDWYELEEKNNWGTGIMVNFKVFVFDSAITLVNRLVENVVREVMCGDSVDISFKDRKCYDGGEVGMWIDEKNTWDNGREG